MSWSTPPGFVLGIDFGGTKIALAAVTTDDGRIIDSALLETDAARGAPQAVERTLAAARVLLDRGAAAVGAECSAVGAVSPGVVLPDRILLAPNVPGWERLALASLLRDGLGVARAVVGTDVKAAALAETLWGSLRGSDPALFLNLGTGLAAAFVADGRVLSGAHGAAGELGYNARDRAAAEPPTLEEVAGGRSIGERAGALAGRPMSAAEAFASELPQVRALVEETLDELFTHLANAIVLLDPARVALGGGLLRSEERILPPLAARLKQVVPFPPQLVRARFPDEGALLGAVALALGAVGVELASVPLPAGERAA